MTLQHNLVVLCNIRKSVVAEKRIEYIACIVAALGLRNGSHDTLLGMAHCEEHLDAGLSWLPSSLRSVPRSTTLFPCLFVNET